MYGGEVSLLCLPYAGGGAATYRDWQARLPDWVKLIAVQLPGRGPRLREEPITDWPTLIDLLLREMQPRLSESFAIFGHSMGALVGIELAHAFRRRTGRTPVWFGASACKAPAHRDRVADWLSCEETRLLEELRTLDGTAPELLENRELLDLMLPAIRADFHLCGTYQPPRRLPLDCPMLVMGGTEDVKVSEPRRHLSDWTVETTGRCSIELLKGGHFFVEKQRDTVIELVIEDLRVALSGGRRACA